MSNGGEDDLELRGDGANQVRDRMADPVELTGIVSSNPTVDGSLWLRVCAHRDARLVPIGWHSEKLAGESTEDQVNHEERHCEV